MFSVTLASPECEVFQGRAHWIVLPGDEGDFGVYPSHMPLIAGLRFGMIEIMPYDPPSQEGETTLRHFCYGGVALVEKNLVRVLSPRFGEGAITKDTLEEIKAYVHQDEQSSCKTLKNRATMMKDWIEDIQTHV